jgi:hypothetical protein
MDSRPKGQITVRMPSGMHQALIEEASRHGVTMNQFVCATLAGAIGWRAGDQTRHEEDSPTREEREEAIWKATWGDLFR